MYFAQNFYKATRNANSSLTVFSHCLLLPTVSFPGLLSQADWSPLPFFVNGSLCLLSDLLSLLHFRSRGRSHLQALCVGFTPKQTKRSSEWCQHKQKRIAMPHVTLGFDWIISVMWLRGSRSWENSFSSYSIVRTVWREHLFSTMLITLCKGCMDKMNVHIRMGSMLLLSWPRWTKTVEVWPTNKKTHTKWQQQQQRWWLTREDKLCDQGCPHGVMVKVMDCGIIVSEFVLQSCYYVHFRANTLGKGMNPLIFPAIG